MSQEQGFKAKPGQCFAVLDRKSADAHGVNSGPDVSSLKVQHTLIVSLFCGSQGDIVVFAPGQAKKGAGQGQEVFQFGFRCREVSYTKSETLLVSLQSQGAAVPVQSKACMGIGTAHWVDGRVCVSVLAA